MTFLFQLWIYCHFQLNMMFWCFKNHHIVSIYSLNSVPTFRKRAYRYTEEIKVLMLGVGVAALVFLDNNSFSQNVLSVYLFNLPVFRSLM